MRIIEQVVITHWNKEEVVYDIHYHVLGWSNRRNRKQVERDSVETEEGILPVTVDDTNFVLQKKNTEYNVVFLIDGAEAEGVRSTDSKHVAYELPKGIEFKSYKHIHPVSQDSDDLVEEDHKDPVKRVTKTLDKIKNKRNKKKKEA